MNPATTKQVRASWTRCALGPDAPAVVALAEISNDPAAHGEVAAGWLCGEEQQRSARFLVDHARRDFLAGRVAAKVALRELASYAAPPSTWMIGRGERHEPTLPAELTDWKVTLAHAGGVGLAVALPARSFCGVDLEPIDRDALEVIATQVSTAEAAWARAATGDEERRRWLLLWTAREALGKSAGTGLLDNAVLRPVLDWVQTPAGWSARIDGRDDVVVRSVVAARHVMSLVVPHEADLSKVQLWLQAALPQR